MLVDITIAIIQYDIQWNLFLLLLYYVRKIGVWFKDNQNFTACEHRSGLYVPMQVRTDGWFNPTTSQ